MQDKHSQDLQALTTSELIPRTSASGHYLYLQACHRLPSMAQRSTTLVGGCCKAFQLSSSHSCCMKAAQAVSCPDLHSLRNSTPGISLSANEAAIAGAGWRTRASAHRSASSRLR